MQINSGDKLTATKKLAGFFDVGDIINVIGTDEDGMVSFTFGDNFMNTGVMDISTCEKHFTKVVNKEKAPKVTFEHIQNIVAHSEITVETVFDKCTVVSCKLPNGFVIVESSACVSPENYDKEKGYEICMDKIVDKIWELEGYTLQEELYRMANNCEECFCDECPCAECYDDDVENKDEGLDTDLDCDDCEDYECPYNTNR